MRRRTEPQGHRRLRFSLSVSTCQRAKDNTATLPAQSRAKEAVVHNHTSSQTLIQEPNQTADEPDISSSNPRVNTSPKDFSKFLQLRPYDHLCIGLAFRRMLSEEHGPRLGQVHEQLCR